MKRRVVVSGLGCITAGGTTRQQFWQNLLQGRSMIGNIERFDVAAFPVKKAGMICDADLLLREHLPLRLLQQTDRHTQLALLASARALEDAHLDPGQLDRSRVGTIIGNNLGGSIFGEEQLLRLHTRGARAVSPFQSIAWFYAATIGQISIKYDLHGYSKTYVADRAGSHFALGDALRAIQDGDLDVCLAGGCEAPISPYALAGYIDAAVLSHAQDQAEPEHYAPFDLHRNGLILGEGSAILILEEASHARRRNAPIYAELCGFGQTCDGVHHRLSNADGVLYAHAIITALREAQVDPEALGCVLVDGSGGRCEDIRETRAINMAFGAHTSTLQVTCPKTMFGHLFGGAGAVDTAIACLALSHGYLPPTVQIRKLDPLCSLPLVRHEAVRLKKKAALVLGTARGGINAALVLRAY